MRSLSSVRRRVVVLVCLMVGVGFLIAASGGAAEPACTITGTAGDDVLTGTPGADVICGEGGNDRLAGAGGNDVLRGGDGNDRFLAGPGADVMEGGAGTDLMDYGARTNPVTVTVGDGANDGAVGEGDDVQADVEEIGGGAGNDTLTAGPAGYQLWGRAGDDMLQGGDGDDMLDGGPGADTFRGGGGQDLAEYHNSTADLTVTIGDGANDGAAGEGDDVQGDVERVGGGSGNDHLTGDGSANQLWGRGGNDTLSGAGGDDQMIGRAGSDTFAGGAGDDRVDYSYESAPVTVTIGGGPNDGTAGEGDDVQSDVETVYGGQNDDHLTGDASANVLNGREGNDTIAGAGGGDRLVGAAGNDSLSGGAGADEVIGRDGADTIHVEGDGGTVDQVSCGADADKVFADAADTLDADCENQPPTAADDSVDVGEDDGATALALLGNDSDPEGRALSIAGIDTTGTVGSASLAAGTVSYDPNGKFNSLGQGVSTTDNFTYTNSDGTDPSAPATVTVTIHGANDAPTAVDDTASTDEDTSVSASAPGVLANDTDPDLGDTKTVTKLNGSSTLSGTTGKGASVSISANGSYSYNPAGHFDSLQVGQTASDSFTYTMSDGHGGDSTATVGLTISGVNDAPVAGDDTYDGAIANTKLAVGTTSSGPVKQISGTVLTGDSDVEGDALTASSSDPDVSMNANGTFTYVPPVGNETSDTFTYTLSDGAKTDTGTVTVNIATQAIWYVKASAPAGGDGRSTSPFNSLASVQAASGAGDADGTNDTIFVYGAGGSYGGGLPLESGQTLDGEAQGLTAGGTTLVAANASNRPTLTNAGGAGVSLASGSTVTGVAISGASGAAISATNTGGSTVNDVTIAGANGGINLTAASGAFTFTGVPITTTGGTAFFANGTGGSGLTLNVGSAGTESVSATGGNGVDIRNVAGTSSVAFDSVSDSGGATGINLDTIGSANASFGSGSISGSTADFKVNGGSGTVSYDGTLADGSGLSTDIQGRTGGTITLSGNINDGSDAGGGITFSGNSGGSTTLSGTTKTLNTGTATAVSSTGSGHTINLTNGGLNIDATSGAGLSATGGGTINVTTGANPNTIDTTTGTTLDVENTAIGSSNLTFQSVTANGGGHGIVLLNTGSSGHLAVTGTGSAGSGGSITGITGADLATNNCGDLGSSAPAGVGVYLKNTNSPSLAYMSFPGTFGNFGILGYNVAGFTLDHSTLTGTYGDNVNVDDDTVHFCTLTGSASITNNTISNGAETNLRLVNASGTLNRLTMTGNTFGLNGNGGGGGVLLEADNNGTVLNATVESNTFQGSRGSPFQAVPQAGASMDLVFGAPGLGNTIHNTHSNIVPFAQDLSVAAGGTLTFDINSNHFDSSSAVQAQGGVFINAANSTANATGHFRNNTIGTSGVANSGSSGNDPGLDVESNGGGDLTIDVTNNQMYQWGSNGAGFLVQAGATSGSPTTVNATVTNNTIAQPGTFAVSNNAQGFQLNNGTNSGENFTTCLKFSGNVVDQGGTGAGGDARFRQRFDTKVQLPGYTGASNGGTSFADMISYIQGLNPTGPPTVTGVSSTANGGGFFNTPAGAACALPSF